MASNDIGNGVKSSFIILYDIPAHSNMPQSFLWVALSKQLPLPLIEPYKLVLFNDLVLRMATVLTTSV
jgi:hypothetical protein